MVVVLSVMVGVTVGKQTQVGRLLLISVLNHPNYTNGEVVMVNNDPNYLGHGVLNTRTLPAIERTTRTVTLTMENQI